jgi:hypothetical protein
MLYYKGIEIVVTVFRPFRGRDECFASFEIRSSNGVVRHSDVVSRTFDSTAEAEAAALRDAQEWIDSLVV